MSVTYASLSEAYRDAVWESGELNSTEKAVAETYARYVRNASGDRTPDADLAWLDYPTLMAKAGIGSRSTVPAVVNRLVEKGWLVVARKVGRRPTLYQISIPASHRRSTGSGTPVVHKWNFGSSESGTTPAASTASRSTESGTTVVQKWNYGSSESGTLPRNYLENPPYPPEEINSPSSGEGSRDGKDFDLEKRKNAIVAKVRERQPSWSARGCLNQIETALADGRDLDLIAEVFFLVAKDPVAQTPKWLNQAHQWWDVAEKRRAARPARCARCHGWRFIPSDPNQPGSERVSCPACVPRAPEPVVAERPASLPLPPPPPEMKVILRTTHKHIQGRLSNGFPSCAPCMGEWSRQCRDNNSASAGEHGGAKIYQLDNRRVS